MKTPDRKIPDGMLGKIRAVRRRRWLLEISTLTILAAALTLGLAGLAVAIDWQFAWRHPLARWASLAVVLAALVTALRARLKHVRLRRSNVDEALDIDRALPGLEERWSTVSELAASMRAPALDGSGELIAQVQAEAQTFVSRIRPGAVIPAARLERPIVGLVAGGALFAAVAVGLSTHFATLLQRLAQPWKPIPLTRITVPTVPPRIVRDDAVEIGAQFSGRLPGSATLLLRDPRGGLRSIVLTPERAAEGVAIKHRLAEISESFAFQIHAGDAATPWIPVQMVDRPTIERLKLRIHPPAYTARPPADWNALPQSARAVRGSRVELELTADQPLTLAALEVVQLPATKRLPLEPGEERSYRFAATLNESLEFSVLLENELGLRALAAECRIEVDEDQPPSVQILENSESVVLSAADTLRVEFEARDDFGVAEAELVAIVEKPGEAPRETVLPISLGKQTGQAEVRSSMQIDLGQFKIDAETKFSYAVRVRDNRGAAAEGQQERSPQGGANASRNGKGRAGEDQRPDPQDSPADSSDAKTDSATKGEGRTAQDTASEKSAGGGDKPGETQNESPAMASAPKGRTLDVAGQSCTPPKPVHIEQFAPRSDRESREKISLAIDPVLKALREAAASALASTESALRNLREDARLDSIREDHVQSGLRALGEAVTRAAQLKKESAGTPYAFFALQADALVAGGLLPAARKLQESLKATPAKPELETAAVHLRWVIETLDTLTRQYTSLKEVQKAEDLLQQIKQMHIAFVEDLPEWLKAGGPAAYQRSMIEVDAAYAKAYEEMLRKRREVMMQLAELLAKEPELAARFLDQQSTTTGMYRDELLRLQREQEELIKVTAATAGPPASNETLIKLWQARLQQAQEHAAEQANRAANAARTWMPKEMSVAQRNSIHNAALIAAGSAKAAAPMSGKTAQTERGFESALDSLERYERALAPLDRDSDYVKNRREDLEQLRSATLQNRNFARLLGAGRFAEALRAAQALLNAETGTIAGLLLQDTVGLAQASPEADEAAKRLKKLLVENVAAPQTNAATALTARTYEPARRAQSSAAAGLGQAVEVLDDFMQKAIRKLDEAKAAAGARPAPAPTFEDLLANLEQEKRSAFSLGMSCRKPNIQVETDMQKKQSSQSKDGTERSASKEAGEPGERPGRPAPGEPTQPTEAERREMDRRLEATRETAHDAARQFASAQQRANERALKLTTELRTATVAETAAGVAKAGSDRRVDWNTLPSELRATLLQERGRLPPKQYEGAIEQYFKTIAGGSELKSAP